MELSYEDAQRLHACWRLEPTWEALCKRTGLTDKKYKFPLATWAVVSQDIDAAWFLRHMPEAAVQKVLDALEARVSDDALDKALSAIRGDVRKGDKLSDSASRRLHFLARTCAAAPAGDSAAALARTLNLRGAVVRALT